MVLKFITIRGSSPMREQSNMLNKRRIADYAVQFIGYSARIIAREGNTDYASLDFVSGTAALFADEGHLIVPNRPALSSAVGDLPLCIDELKSLVKSVTPDSGTHRVELGGGKVSIEFNRGADVERAV